MKRKLLTVLVAVLALLMVGSVFMTALSMARSNGTRGLFADGRYQYDALAEKEPTFNTTIPTAILDFTTDKIQENFGHQNTVSWKLNEKEGYTTFTATAGVPCDPYVMFNSPISGKVVDCQYVLIKYRTTAPVRGEFFSTRPSTGAMGQSGTNLQWDWNANGEWNADVIHCNAWSNAADSDVFTNFRFDPMEQIASAGIKVNSGDTLDIQFAAFFKTEADAKGFDLNEYVKKLAWEEEQKNQEDEADKTVNWPDPTYKEMETVEKDLNIGTIKYTPSDDGTTMTISYEVAGETISYTVPNNHNYTSGGYAGVDDLGRPLYNSDEVGSYKGDERYVGLFYFLWQGEHGDNGVFDLQKIIDELGVDGADNTDCGRYGPVGAMHFFAEPLYGYYYANDAWVLRKHAELLTNANIDFLYFDTTNGYPYLNNAKKLMEVLHQLNEEGYDAPQVVFYTNSSANSVVQQVYNSIYSKGLYEDTWFCIDGKPVIIAPESANIDGFFHTKQNQWPNEASKSNGWPWMDFNWPARVFPSNGDDGGAISVSIAQHSGTVCFSHSSLYKNATNRGRSFTNPDGYTTENSLFIRSLRASYRDWLADPTLTLQGLNFQAQWDHAIASDATYILVTGWNEWVAQRQKTGDGTIIFVDTASMEFSRDAEMMRGGYFDNYYLQLIYNVQKLKGTAPIIVQDNRKPINVTGEFDQWDDIVVEYKDPTGDTMNRDAIGFGRTPYKNDSGRNDFVTSKVVSDTKNLYFYTSTVDDVTMFDTDSSWMQLYINSDADAATGWYGYDYIVNYKAKDAFTTTVAKYNGQDGAYGFEPIGEVSYRAKGNQMMIAVPLEMLGIEHYYAIDLEFKWADSKTLYDEMEDFYCDGDMAPLGRLNYVYQNYIEGKSIFPEDETIPDTEIPTEEPTEEPTEVPTEEPTDISSEAPSEAPTDAPTDVPTAAPSETPDAETERSGETGCKSVVACSSLLCLITLAGAALILRRKA